MPDYIERRRQGWYFVIDIPKKLWGQYEGKKRHVQSLKTDSRSEALIRAKPLAAQWLNEFHAYRTGKSPLTTSFITTARQWREDLKAANDNPHKMEVLDGVLDDYVSDLAWKDPIKADTLRGLVKGEYIPTEEHLERYIAVQRQRVAEKTADMRKSDILEFSEGFPTTERITRQNVKRWAYGLESQGVKPQTIVRKLGALRGYWGFLQDIEAINREDDPFKDAYGRAKRQPTKMAADSERKPLTDAQVMNLLRMAQTKRTPDHQLADLIRLGMWTGCRIEELCSLKADNVKEASLIVEDAKSRSGNREVPIHPQLKPTLRRLIDASTDGYVLSGLTFNKYGDRSNAIGKRFGKLKLAMGLGPEYVFHSIRKTVVTILENAGVSEGVVADLVGHEKQTMTFGLYSGGSTLNRKADAMSLLTYEGWTTEDAHNGGVESR